MRQNTLFPFLFVSSLAGAVGGALGAAWYVSSRVNPVPRRTYADRYTFTPWELGVPYEPVTLSTTDGVRLSAWWMPRPEAQSVVIGCHGHVGAKPDLLGIGTGSWRAGHNVLLFDFRGRGESDPWPNTLVSREVDDLLSAVAYVRTRMPAARIGVVGFSMGAAVTLLAAAQEPAIAAVVADSPFAAASDVVADGIRTTLRLGAQAPLGPLLGLVDALVDRQHGYRLSKVRPLDAVSLLAPRPLLLIHGTADTTIPVAHAQRIFAAAREPKQLWLYEGVDHCGAYFADRVGYVQRVTTFFDQYLKSFE